MTSTSRRPRRDSARPTAEQDGGMHRAAPCSYDEPEPGVARCALIESPRARSRAAREPSMIDVAALAGVSHQTVSRVVNNRPYVTEQTRLKVHAAIATLNYRPNIAARTLVTGTSNVIGVVAQTSTLYSPAAILAALAATALQHGFTVRVDSVRTQQGAPIAAAIQRHLDARVAGLVVIASVAAAGSALDQIPHDVALVGIDGDPGRSGALVAIDHETGAYAATRYLLDAGHRTVWHVGGPSGRFDTQGRIAGWTRALTDVGAEIPPVLPTDGTAAAGYQSGRLLARMPAVTAVFAANDHLALGILRALHEHGRRVPADVSVVGFDDVPQAAFFIPPLTTVRPDFTAVASASVELLLDQIGTRRGRGERRLLAPQLVLRDSVAPPPVR